MAAVGGKVDGAEHTQSRRLCWQQGLPLPARVRGDKVGSTRLEGASAQASVAGGRGAPVFPENRGEGRTLREAGGKRRGRRALLESEGGLSCVNGQAGGVVCSLITMMGLQFPRR